MVFGVLISNVEDMSLYYSRFYGEQANDTKKSLRIKFLISKLQENCTQQKETYRERQKLLTFVTTNSIVSSKIKESLTQESTVVTEKENYEGTFHISEERLFPTEIIGIWRQRGRLCVCLLLDPTENKKLAINIVNKIFEEKVLKSTMVFQNWEDLCVFLDVLIPEGNLMFYSPSNINFFLPVKT